MALILHRHCAPTLECVSLDSPSYLFPPRTLRFGMALPERCPEQRRQLWNTVRIGCDRDRCAPVIANPRKSVSSIRETNCIIIVDCEVRHINRVSALNEASDAVIPTSLPCSGSFDSNVMAGIPLERDFNIRDRQPHCRIRIDVPSGSNWRRYPINQHHDCYRFSSSSIIRPNSSTVLKSVNNCT